MHIPRLARALLGAFLLSHSSFAIPRAGAAPFPVEETTVAAVHSAYRARLTTVTAVLRAHLDRIDAYDQRGPILNSVINLHPAALAEAAALDAALAAAPAGSLPPAAGSLWGIPVAVKDCIDVAGVPMTGGFQGWKNYVPPADAPQMARLRAAGGLLFAKVSLSEFTRGGGDNINSVLGGFARNPYHTAYATGGSSGGTGSAIAASFAILGIGTDTGGSIRMPAAHNALFGLRPTVGLVSRTGIVPNNSVRDTAGPMTRTVADGALLMDALLGPDPADPATARIPAAYAPPARPFTAALNKDALRGARLGVLRQAFPPARTHPRILAHFERTLAELRAAGAELIDPFVVPELDTLPRAPQTAARRKADMVAFLAAHPGIPYPTPEAIAASKLAHPLHQPGLEADAAAGPVDNDPDTLQGLATENAYRAAFTREMDAARVDALVFPTWAQPPVLNGDRNTQLMTPEPRPAPAAGPTGLGASLTFVGSTLQWPALSVPSGFLSDPALPLGLQMLGRAWDDARLVGFAYAYEQATLHRRSPAATPPLGAEPAEPFLGTWRLVAIRDRDTATGMETPAARGAVDGQLYYAPNGRMSVQIIRTGRTGATANADGFSSYFGRWTLLLEEGCMVHHQEGQLNPAQTGVSAKRYYSFDKNGWLSLATPARRATPDAPERQSVFVWERIR